MKFRNFNVPDSEFSGSGAARRASRVIDKAGGGAYLSPRSIPRREKGRNRRHFFALLSSSSPDMPGGFPQGVRRPSADALGMSSQRGLARRR
jgi:hypothetical protein